ncbi:MAG: hypothetical protein WA879_09725 [Candidatus Acidiferrales bacterium]
MRTTKIRAASVWKRTGTLAMALATMIALGPGLLDAQAAQDQSQPSQQSTQQDPAQQNAAGPDATTQDPLHHPLAADGQQDNAGQSATPQADAQQNSPATQETTGQNAPAADTPSSNAAQQNQQQNQMTPPPPPPSQNGSRDYDAYANQGRPAVVPPSAPLPQSLAVAGGAIVQVRTSGWLSSDQNVAGDSFTATLAQPIVVDGWVVARRGQTVIGRVVEAQKAGRVKGVSHLGIALSSLTLVDGQQLNIQTQLMQSTGGTSNGRDAMAVGATTGVGAAIGGAAAGGAGAAIGAGAGLVASIAGVLVTRGRPTVIPPETLLTFQLQTPVTISTARGAMAFRAVTPADYANNGPAARPRLLRGPYGYRYPPPYAYYGPGPYYGNYWYGPPVIGFGYYGWHRW